MEGSHLCMCFRQFYSAFNPANMSLQPVPFMPMQTGFRSYSGLDNLEQRLMKGLRRHFTWKCTALVFVIVTVILVLFLSCLIGGAFHHLLYSCLGALSADILYNVSFCC